MTPKSGIARALADALRIRQELGGQAMNDIPPAVTLYWQEERIKELEAKLAECASVGNRIVDQKMALATEVERLRAALEWAVQELRRVDHGGHTDHVADTLSEVLAGGSPHEP